MGFSRSPPPPAPQRLSGSRPPAGPFLAGRGELRVPKTDLRLLRPTFPAPGSPAELGDGLSSRVGATLLPTSSFRGPKRSSVVQRGRDERFGRALPIAVLGRRRPLGQERLPRARQAGVAEVVSPQGFVPRRANGFVRGLPQRPEVRVGKREGAGFPRRHVLERRGRTEGVFSEGRPVQVALDLRPVA